MSKVCYTISIFTGGLLYEINTIVAAIYHFQQVLWLLLFVQYMSIHLLLQAFFCSKGSDKASGIVPPCFLLGILKPRRDMKHKSNSLFCSGASKSSWYNLPSVQLKFHKICMVSTEQNYKKCNRIFFFILKKINNNLTLEHDTSDKTNLHFMVYLQSFYLQQILKYNLSCNKAEYLYKVDRNTCIYHICLSLLSKRCVMLFLNLFGRTTFLQVTRPG